MGRSIVESLEITQMIVPEVDLKINIIDDKETVKVDPVPFNEWHYYLDALHSATELMTAELEQLPDVDQINELKEVSVDIESLVICLRLFYISTMQSLERSIKKNPDLAEKFDRLSEKDVRRMQRVSKYRSINTYEEDTE